MESDSKKRSKPRLRFNFSTRNETKKSATTRDQILDSLSRQPQLGHQDNGETGREVESADLDQFNQQDPSPSRHIHESQKRHAGRSAFLVFVGGFVAIWAYGFLTKAYDIPGLSSLTQTPEAQVGIQIVSANPVQAGLILAGAFLSALYVRHRRKGSNSRLNPQRVEYDSGWS